MANTSTSLPIRLLIQYALTLLLLWLLATFLPQFLEIGGDWRALPTIAALLLLLNIFARPLLNILTLPLKLFLSVVAVILANAAFLWLLERIAERFDPSVASMTIEGGWIGWFLIALLIGIGNWFLHRVF